MLRGKPRNRTSTTALEGRVHKKDLRETVGRASRGDRDAAATLFREYHPRVYRYALGKLRDGAGAEDAAAETFAKVLVELKRFRWRGGGFEPWLFRIATNVVMDHFRRTGREQVTEGSEGPMGTGPGPETAVIEKEEAAKLKKMVDDLGDEQREVILLRFAAGLTCEETARVMGRSSNSVRQIQFRAMKKLRSMETEHAGELA